MVSLRKAVTPATVFPPIVDPASRTSSVRETVSVSFNDVKREEASCAVREVTSVRPITELKNSSFWVRPATKEDCEEIRDVALLGMSALLRMTHEIGMTKPFLSHTHTKK